jgi:ankyrin repeat protein
LLVQQGADVNKRDRKGWAPLHIAAQDGYLKTVEILVSNGADVNLEIHRWAPLLLAVNNWVQDKKWRVRISNYLMDNGAHVTAADYHGRTALHRVSRRGEERLARLLIEKGADINAADRWG